MWREESFGPYPTNADAVALWEQQVGLRRDQLLRVLRFVAWLAVVVFLVVLEVSA